MPTLSPLNGPRQTRQPSGGGHCPGPGRFSRGHGSTGSGNTVHPTNHVDGFPGRAEEAPPRGGAPLDGVTSPAGIRVPRVRQAPDGCQSSGSQPTESRVLNRRMFLAPPLPMGNSTKRTSRCRTRHENFALGLDSGSHSNAHAQRRGPHRPNPLTEPKSCNAPLAPRPLQCVVRRGWSIPGLLRKIL